MRLLNFRPRAYVRLLGSSFGEFRRNHKSLRRRTNVVDGIAGNQSKPGIVRLLQHREVIRFNYLLTRYLEAQGLSVALDHDAVTFVQFVNVAEECVSMRRDHRVSRFSGQRRSYYASGPV